MREIVFRVNRGLKMIARKYAWVINLILTAAYTALALWVDWRIAVIIFLYDISIAFDLYVEGPRQPGDAEGKDSDKKWEGYERDIF
jgi:hypothetical protein